MFSFPIFLSPLFLIGAVSALIPLIIHLSRSKRTKKLRFSTTRFFTDQFLRSYRMSRVKELLLLIVRMAVCFLLAVALAKPLWPTGQTMFFGGSRSLVLVIDNSASMGYSENGVTLLDRARGVVKELLEGLGPNDTVSVVLAGWQADGPEVLWAQPTSDRDEVRKRIEGLEVAALGTDLTRALAKAGDIAKALTESSKEVYVISDLQDSGWELPDKNTPVQPAADVLYFFVKVRPREVSNLAITAVQYGAARPMVGVPFSIRPHITSKETAGVVADKAGKPGEVRLIVDGEKVGERKLEKLADGRWVFPRFYHTFSKGGWHSGHVEIDDDGLALDNRRYFAFEVLTSIKVLAINGASSAVPRLDELFFLKTALTASPTGKEEDAPIQLAVLGPADVSTAKLGEYPLVILANVETLSDDAVEKLESYVDQGGNLLVFLGDKVDPAAYNQKLAAVTRMHGGLLPGRLLGLKGNPAGADSFADVSDVAYSHPALAAFQDPKANLGGVAFKALWEVQPNQAVVLMRAREKSAAADAKQDNNPHFPLLLEKTFGKGRVVLFASTCDRDWTNFPVRAVYLPWVHRLVGYLAQEPMGKDAFYLTGGRVPVSVSAAEGLPRVQITKPDGTSSYAVRTEDGDPPFAFKDTSLPGVYKISSEKPDGNPLFAVNLDSYESDLTYLDDFLASWDKTPDFKDRDAKVQAGFQKLLGDHPLVAYVDDPARVGDVALAARRGLKLWDIVLALVLLLALFEPWLANRISLRHYAKPKELAEPAAPRAGRWGRLPQEPAPEPQTQEAHPE